ncbi:MAG: VCBS repeat-containing protein [Deltaproteobacteria bacterium]|nr:VCBS repeat-containing protein [Deltaproteobacteria bacterium]
MSLRFPMLSVLFLASSSIACGGGGDQTLEPGADTGGTTEETSADTFEPFDSGECNPPCAAGFTCWKGACIQEQPCTKDDECQNDTYCDPALGKCIPYGAPGKVNNPDCASVVPVGLFAPEVYCEFGKAPDGDTHPTFLNVLATPMVATFEKGGTPSIVVPFYNGFDGSSEQDGILRVLSGKDCSQTANLAKVGPENAIVSASSSVAIGDLDGDAIPEIVAYSKPTSATGSVVAFSKKSGSWAILWRARRPDGTAWTAPGARTEWAGPSIHDLDDDGKPEVLREGFVFSNTGTLIADQPAGFVYGYGTGQFPVVADIDGDGSVEMVNGAAIYRFNKTTKKWDTVVASVTGGFAGLTALADFGTKSVDGVFDKLAEIVVVYGGKMIVESHDGTVVWGPLSLPGSAGGGPPTVADFDGDGQPEIAVAGSNSYTVFDPDCVAASVRPGGKCNTGRTDSILWSKKSQDFSSNITGSSVFDFDADGVAEAVYADECFARVYKGTTGEVVFSQYMSSCTWYENPIVADVNNDDRAELIIPSNLNCGTGTAGRTCEAGEVEYPDTARPGVAVDAVFSGLRCDKATDCVSGVCDSGFCRCTADEQCCPAKDAAKCMEVGFICMPAPSGTPGTGKTCRASHPHGFAGLRVYHDFADRWVRSRPLWNQHAYSITNVNDDGTIPQTSKWVPNWASVTPKYNDFRKNTPGTNDPLKSPDLTTKGTNAMCTDGKLTLAVQVCNRGASKAPANYKVSFYEGSTADPSKVICTATTTKPLEIAECETLSCEWAAPPKTETDVYVLIDAEGHVRQCNKGNKSTLIKGVKCSTPA